MRIALYYPRIDLKSGVERTILEILRRSKDDYTIFTNRLDLKNTFPEFKKIKIVELNKIPKRGGVINSLKTAYIISRQKIDLKNFDCLQVHTGGLSDLVLIGNPKIPVTCFCYTPLRSVFDKSYIDKSPSQKKIIKKHFSWILSFFYTNLIKSLWRRYESIIFISAESHKRAGPITPKNAKTYIINPGVNKTKKENRKFESFFLLPGRIVWSKNIELAISAFEKFYRKAGKPGFKLVIAGQLESKSDSYYNECVQKSKNMPIEFVANPSDSKLNNLYDSCYSVLATALNEDWGITPIEANSHGKPVICVNSGGFKESQKNGVTGFLVSPDPERFSKKMLLLANDKKFVKKLGDNGYKNSLKYDWEKFIVKFDNAIHDNTQV